MSALSVETYGRWWWFHYTYSGLNIDVQMLKTCYTPESAIAQASWRIYEEIEKIDAGRRQ